MRRTSEIVTKGEYLYRKLANFYQSEDGKYMAIDVDTEKPYIGETPERALMEAQRAHPEGSFHLVRLGFGGLYRVASYGHSLARQ